MRGSGGATVGLRRGGGGGGGCVVNEPYPFGISRKGLEVILSCFVSYQKGTLQLYFVA